MFSGRTSTLSSSSEDTIFFLSSCSSAVYFGFNLEAERKSGILAEQYRMCFFPLSENIFFFLGQRKCFKSFAYTTVFNQSGIGHRCSNVAPECATILKYLLYTMYTYFIILYTYLQRFTRKISKSQKQNTVKFPNEILMSIIIYNRYLDLLARNCSLEYDS